MAFTRCVGAPVRRSGPYPPFQSASEPGYVPRTRVPGASIAAEGAAGCTNPEDAVRPQRAALPPLAPASPICAECASCAAFCGIGAQGSRERGGIGALEALTTSDDATGQSRLETPRRGLSPSRARFAPLRFRFRRGTGHHPLVDESLEKIKGGAEAREHVDGETVTNKLCCSFMCTEWARQNSTLSPQSPRRHSTSGSAPEPAGARPPPHILAHRRAARTGRPLLHQGPLNCQLAGAKGTEGGRGHGARTTHLYSLELTRAAISAGILERVAIYLDLSGQGTVGGKRPPGSTHAPRLHMLTRRDADP